MVNEDLINQIQNLEEKRIEFRNKILSDKLLDNNIKNIDPRNLNASFIALFEIGVNTVPQDLIIFLVNIRKFLSYSRLSLTTKSFKDLQTYKRETFHSDEYFLGEKFDRIDYLMKFYSRCLENFIFDQNFFRDTDQPAFISELTRSFISFEIENIKRGFLDIFTLLLVKRPGDYARDFKPDKYYLKQLFEPCAENLDEILFQLFHEINKQKEIYFINSGVYESNLKKSIESDYYFAVKLYLIDAVKTIFQGKYDELYTSKEIINEKRFIIDLIKELLLELKVGDEVQLDEDVKILKEESSLPFHINDTELTDYLRNIISNLSGYEYVRLKKSFRIKDASIDLLLSDLDKVFKV